jgi:hypothetical protein
LDGHLGIELGDPPTSATLSMLVVSSSCPVAISSSQRQVRSARGSRSASRAAVVHAHHDPIHAGTARRASLTMAHAIIGARQPTAGTIRINAGRAEPLDTVAGDNDYGDGTSGGAHRRQPSFNSPPGTSSLPAKSSPSPRDFHRTHETPSGSPSSTSRWTDRSNVR